jgi:hypothetical protein
MIFDNYDNVGTEEFLSQTKREMDSMDAAMAGLDDDYAEWLCGQPEAMVCNGNILIERMEAGWGWDDFLASRK